MMFLGWIVNRQKTPPPLLKEAEVMSTEQIMQAYSARHQLPDPSGQGELKGVAQGLRMHFDARLSANLAGLLLAHPTAYPTAKQDAEELRQQLLWRTLAERLWSVLRGQWEQALFGLQLREAYLAEYTSKCIERVDTLRAAAAAAGVVPAELAAVHAGVWPAYERLNQRSQQGAAEAAAQRSEGEQDSELWRSYALALEERVSVAEARIRQQLEQATEHSALRHSAPAHSEEGRRAPR